MTATVALVAASAGILSPIVSYWVSLGAGKTQGADLGQVTAAASLSQAVGSAPGGLLFNVALIPNAGFVAAPSLSPPVLPPALGFPAFSGSLRGLWRGSSLLPKLTVTPRRSAKLAAIRMSTAPEVD